MEMKYMGLDKKKKKKCGIGKLYICKFDYYYISIFIFGFRNLQNSYHTLYEFTTCFCSLHIRSPLNLRNFYNYEIKD